MKKQILVIHGGGSFVGTPRSELVNELKKKEIDLERFRRKESWRTNLQKDLGEEYDVLYPHMPNSDDPRYLEWKTWFEQIIPSLDKEIILIGHSLGALFLFKYLSEEVFSKTILGLFSVAAPYVEKGGKWDDTGFALGEDFSKLNQARNIFLYHSKDDKVVNFSDLGLYKSKIPSSIVRELDGRNHIFENNLPEIIEDIKSL